MFFKTTMLFFILLIVTGLSSAATQPPKELTIWVDHWDTLFPVLKFAFGGMLKVISGLLGFIGLLLTHFYRQWKKKERSRELSYLASQKKREEFERAMLEKISDLFHVVAGCDGCKKSLDKMSEEKELMKYNVKSEDCNGMR